MKEAIDDEEEFYLPFLPESFLPFDENGTP